MSIYPNDDCRYARGGAADRGEYRQAAGPFAQERLVIQCPQSQKRRLRITPGLCFRSPDCFRYFTRVRLRCGNKNDYGCGIPGVGRRISRVGARIASKESSRLAYIKWAEIWLELASRAERLTALIEDPSKEPTPTAEYVWQPPSFHHWPRNRIAMRIRKRQRSSVGPRTFDQLAFDFAKI